MTGAAVRSPLGVILLGAAHIHVGDLARVVRSQPGAEVVSVWDHQPDRAEQWGASLGATGHADLDAALAAGNAHGALVYSETSRHRELASAAAARGLAVFVEKPLAARPNEAALLAKGVAPSPTFSTGFFLRYATAFSALRARVARGDVGAVRQARVRVVHGGLARGWFDGDHAWMRDRAEGGGGFFDLVVHGLDLVAWVLGPIEQVGDVRIAASGHHGTGVVRAGGARVDIEAGWEARDTAMETTVEGADGTLTASGGDLVAGPDSTVVASGAPPDAGDAPRAWLDTLAGGGPHGALVSVDDAVEAVRATARLRRRATVGRGQQFGPTAQWRQSSR
jgi:predicted dehydrogenase